MARNTELIRQWEILREIDAVRTGVTVSKLAATQRVHERTIRRDIDALCKAGFSLYDDKINGTPKWKLETKPFRALEETGLSVTELCALYFSRELIGALTGTPFFDEMERAIMKLQRALPAGCRRFLDRMPAIVKAKATGRKILNARKSREIVARINDAALRCRRVTMRYSSASSHRTKDYIIEPQRMTYAAGGIYLSAWVPEYRQTRTFALERIRALAVMDDHFEPRRLPAEPFANSIGVHNGSPEPIEIEIDARAADYVREREWHRSQEIIAREDGSLLLRLCVCDDLPLRSWIHSLGPMARVVFPSRLAREILEEIEEAREHYQPRLKFEMLRMPSIDSQQAPLPLSPHSKAS